MREMFRRRSTVTRSRSRESVVTNVSEPAGQVEIAGETQPDAARVLTPDALAFVARLHRAFNPTRLRLLEARATRQAALDAGERPGLLAETAGIRAPHWSVAAPPPALAERHVEITGPADRKMMINALNSGESGFMADLEDSLAPTWANIVRPHGNVICAVQGTLSYESPDGRTYRLAPKLATLLMRPRGWHLDESHMRVDGQPVPASLFDFGMFCFHHARPLAARGAGPFFYLPKMESHREARLWNDVFVAAQGTLGIPRGTIRATVLIETILAAFEMEEILYELRGHGAALNAGRWDYLFSIIKKFRTRGKEFVLPERNSVTMTAPFMRAYTELLVRTCHSRGAHAMGGMAAFIPSRRDPEVNPKALAKVRDDKQRESSDGFDGSWVAHPDLVPVCREIFDPVLGDTPNQLGRLRAEVQVTAADLLSVSSTPGQVTEAGLRNNVSVGLQYLANCLPGNGAVAIFNLMEDAATAEISRSQVWQWLHNDVSLAEGQQVTAGLVEQIITEELAGIREQYGAAFDPAQFDQAVALFKEVALADDYADFLTIPAYERMP